MDEQDLKQPVSKEYLGEFMEKSLLPAISSLMDEKLKPIEQRLADMEKEIKVLSANLRSHLELSDKRYLELKYRDTLIAKWIKQIADKTGVNIDLTELEKF